MEDSGVGTDNGEMLATRHAKEAATTYGIGFIYQDEFGQFKSLDPRKVRVLRRTEDVVDFVDWSDENVEPVT